MQGLIAKATSLSQLFMYMNNVLQFRPDEKREENHQTGIPKGMKGMAQTEW